MTHLESRPGVTSKLPPDIKLSPTLMHIVDFLVKIGYNPTYKEDQETILHSLATAPVEEVLPQSIKAVYDLAKERQIQSLACKLDDHTIVKIDSGPNEISAIRHLEPSGRLLGIFQNLQSKIILWLTLLPEKPGMFPNYGRILLPQLIIQKVNRNRPPYLISPIFSMPLM